VKESEEGLYLRGSTYWIRYRGPRPDGSWGDVRQSAKRSDPKIAAKLLDRKRRESANLKEGIAGYVSPRSEKLAVGELLDAVVGNGKPAGDPARVVGDYELRKLKSLRQARVHAAPVRAFFGSMRAVSVRPQQVSAYVAKRRGAKKADATIDRELELLRRAYALAAENKELPATFAPRIPKLVRMGANARQGFWEPEEFERFVSELPGDVLPDLWRFGYLTAMRLGEIRSLLWSNYDRETKTIRLAAADAKTGRPRLLALASMPELLAVIERRQSARRLGCDLIFHNGAGLPVGDFYTTAKRALERAKLAGKTFHDLRRTSVRNMIRAGVPERIAMEISGHRTRAIFDRYNIVNEADVEKALAQRSEYEARTKTRTTEGGA
jgi:integrase